MASWGENWRPTRSHALLILLGIAIATVSGCAMPCKERLEANRRLFEQKCAKSFSGLNESHSCRDTCDEQSTVAKDKCMETCDTCKQLLESIAHLEKTCGPSD
jgi:hypothetical protein